MIWLKLAWKFLGWRGALGLAGLVAAGTMGVVLLITSARLDAARATLKQQQAECAGQIAELEQRLVAVQAEAAALSASAAALAGQVRDTEESFKQERRRAAQARAALANVKPVPLTRAEVDHAVVDLDSSARVAAVLNGMFGVRPGNATRPGAPAPGPGLPEPGAAGAGALEPGRAPGQRP